MTLPPQSDAYLTAILDAITDAVIVQDRTGKLIYANKLAASLFGFPSSGNMLSLSLEQVCEKVDITGEGGQPFSFVPLVERVIENGQSDEVMVWVQAKTTRAERWLNARVIGVIDPKGPAQFAVITFHDVTIYRETQLALQQQTEIVETINRVGQLLSAQLDLQVLVQAITDAATSLVGAEFGSFFYNVLDERGESYMLYTLSGVPPEAFSKFPMPRNTKVFAPTFSGSGVVRSDDITQDPRYGQNEPYNGMPKGHLPVVSYLAVPVISPRTEVIGGLFFGHSKPGAFTKREEELVVGLAAQASIAMDNAQLYSDVEAEKERLQVTLSSIGDAVIATDVDGKITFMNRIAEKVTGWQQREAWGKPIERVFYIKNQDTGQSVETPVRKVIREGSIVGLANHTVLIARDGREIPIDDSGAPIRNAQGIMMGVVLVFRDVTERRQADHALAESEQRYRLLFETATDAILVTDEQGRYVDANPQAERLTGYSRDELLKLSIWDISSLNMPDGGRTMFAEFIGTGQMSGEYQLRRKDGRLVDVEFSATYVSPERYQSILRDVTERKQFELERQTLLERERIARQQAEDANDMKMRFLGMISHELRTPLASIKGYSSTLLATDVAWAPTDQREFLTIMDQEANRLTNLVDQLLDVSRLQAGTLSIHSASQKVETIIESVRPQLNVVAQNHQLVLSIPDPLPEVVVDVQRIGQVLVNLVDNAAKYSPEKSTIQLSAQQQSDFVRFLVTDEGEGIPPEDRLLVFEAFRQLREKVARRRGAGLGLAICQLIIEAHGGKIWIEDPKSRGTVVAFTLPVAQNGAGETS